MDLALDIYVKLIIATLTFVAPLMVLFISLFSKAATEKNLDQQESEKKLREEMKQQLAEGYDPLELAQAVTSKRIRDAQLTQIEIRLLNSKRQVVRIFRPLAWSLVLVAIGVYLRKDGGPHLQHYWPIFIVTSAITYIWAILIIRKVLWNIINLVERNHRKEAGAVPE